MELFEILSDSRAKIIPRCYQIKDHDESFRLWDGGEVGTLTRSATGSGKTIMACLKIDTWLRRNQDYRAMIISYETQLVWQFAQEVEDVLGIKPGIEMDAESIDPGMVPLVSVVSRASLLRATPPTPEQIAELMTFGIKDIGATPGRSCKRILNLIRKGTDVDLIKDEIRRLNERPEANGPYWSRLHKFPNAFNWLLIFDEAHRHAYHLASVGHIVDWFDNNPLSRRNGITATPKRGDEVSLGYKMFPGISLDYPLYSPNKPCAVKDGYAVPYVQIYIEVEGVDFKTLNKIGEDFDDADLERKLGEEETLAKLVIPTLEKVGERQTLVFNPGVEMSRNVARFINARARAKCHGCQQVAWYPRLLIGDGAECKCGTMLIPSDIVAEGELARQLDGSSPDHERRQVYKDFEEGKFQFLSVCGLCREGYNNPNVAAVACFRPVSKKASGLAEQMKGRSCRLCRDLARRLHEFPDAPARIAAIAASPKPDALIIDLVGITGLADCASTIQIYGDGLPDILEGDGVSPEDAKRLAEEILERAEEILLEKGLHEVTSIEDAIKQAKEETDAAREKVKLEREAAEKKAREVAEKRAKASAEVSYTEHEVGYGKQQSSLKEASDGQYRFASLLGMEIKRAMGSRQIGRIIGQLKKRMPLQEVARLNHLSEDEWEARRPSSKQMNFANWKGVPSERAKTPYDMCLLIDAKLEPGKFVQQRQEALSKAKDSDELTAVAKDIGLVRGILPEDIFSALVEEGKRKRHLMESDEIPE